MAFPACRSRKVALLVSPGSLHHTLDLAPRQKRKRRRFVERQPRRRQPNPSGVAVGEPPG